MSLMGIHLPTHNLAVFYPSVEGMDDAFLKNALSADWNEFLTEFGAASNTVLNVMFEPTGITNNNADALTSDLYASRWIVIDVTDEAAFAAEWQQLVNSDPTQLGCECRSLAHHSTRRCNWNAPSGLSGQQFFLRYYQSEILTASEWLLFKEP